MLYSFDWHYPQTDRPSRVRLADGSTRTAEAITDEMLKADGWIIVEDQPAPLHWHTVEWHRHIGWVQVPKPRQPYPSWVPNASQTDWEPPVAKPDDGKQYRWNEATIGWEEFSLSDAIIAP